MYYGQYFSFKYMFTYSFFPERFLVRDQDFYRIIDSHKTIFCGKDSEKGSRSADRRIWKAGNDEVISRE